MRKQAERDATNQIGPHIGGRLRAARSAARMTQRNVAERVELTVESYSRIECGRTVPSIATLIALAEVLGVSLIDVLSGLGPPQRELKSQHHDDHEAAWREELTLLLAGHGMSLARGDMDVVARVASQLATARAGRS